VELTNAGNGGPFTAQITRGDAEALALREGDTVYVRATRVPPIADEVLHPHASRRKIAQIGPDFGDFASARA
jgi:sulfate transport system ATP-binding protein